MNGPFDIHLISNVSTNIFPENKPSKFSTIIAEEVILKDPWEVAVSKIIYPTKIASTTANDEIYFYRYINSDRKEFTDFRRGISLIGSDWQKASEVPPNIPKMIGTPYNTADDYKKLVAKNDKALEIDGYKISRKFSQILFPYNILFTMNKIKEVSTMKAFHFTWTSNAHFHLHIDADDLVIELIKPTQKYLNFKYAFYDKGTHESRFPVSFDKRVPDKFMFNLWDISYYDKLEYDMTYDELSNSFISKEAGFSLGNERLILDSGKQEYLFFKFDEATMKIMLRGLTPSIFRRKRYRRYAYRKLSKDEWSELTHVVKKPKLILVSGHMKAEQFVREEKPFDKISLANEKRFTKAEGLLSFLNAKVSTHDYSFTYDSKKERFALTVGDKYVVSCSPSLMAILGFDYGDSDMRFFHKMTVYATYFPILHRAVTLLNIYSNIVESSLVGNVKVPLLSSCAFRRGSENDIVSQLEFFNPSYITLNRNSIRQIDIQIHDEAGELVPFLYGKTAITLHFRKKQWK